MHLVKDWAGKFDGLRVTHDAGSRTAIVSFEASEVPSCTMRVVRSLHAAYDAIAAAVSDGYPIEQLVVSSLMDGIFNMGGDLALMASAARANDRQTLEEYGRLTAGLVHRTWDGLGLGLTTIAAVDGDAFGGGFEAALSANLVVATRASRFAFPETRFGLFPGMGATSLVGRRASPAFASSIIADGRTLDARQAFAAGLVDRVVTRDAAQCVSRCLRAYPSARAKLAEVARLRRLEARYAHAEAETVVLQWVDSVTAASSRTISHIERIVKAQKARMAARPVLS